MSEDAPVSQGDELDVVVEAEGDKGDGIAKVQGFVLFVSGTDVGDKVTIRVTKVLDNVGFAEVLEEHEDNEEETDVVEVDEDTGKERIVGEKFEVEYDPDEASEDFG